MERETQRAVIDREARCPCCHQGFDHGAPTLICEGCAATYHRDCLRYNLGRCVVGGCSGTRARPGEWTPPRVEPVDAALRVVPRVAAVVCPVCKDDLRPGDPSMTCVACGTRHHVDCRRDIGRCSVRGCTGELPARSPLPGDAPIGPFLLGLLLLAVGLG